MTAPRSETRQSCAALYSHLRDPIKTTQRQHASLARDRPLQLQPIRATACPDKVLSFAIVGPCQTRPPPCQGPHPPPVARYRSSTPDLQPPRCLADGYQRSRMPRVTSRPQRGHRSQCRAVLAFLHSVRGTRAASRAIAAAESQFGVCLLELRKQSVGHDLAVRSTSSSIEDQRDARSPSSPVKPSGASASTSVTTGVTRTPSGDNESPHSHERGAGFGSEDRAEQAVFRRFSRNDACDVSEQPQASQRRPPPPPPHVACKAT